MPTVKADLNNRVSLQPIDGTPIRAVDATAGARAIAQGAGNLGQALGQAAETMRQIDDIYDEAAVARADTIALTRLSEAQRAATAAQGFDAQAAQAAYNENIRATAEEIETSLSNPRQRQMFRDMYARRAATGQNAVADHANRQVLTARRAQGDARLEAAATFAVDNMGNPEAEEAFYQTAEAEIRVAFAGAGPEVISQKMSQAASTYRVLGARRLEAEDPIAAQQYIDEHAGEILPEAEVDLRNRLRPRVDAALVEGATAMVFDTTSAPVDNGEAPADGEGVYTSGTAPPAAEGEAAPAAAPVATPAAPVARDPLRGRGSAVSSRFGVVRPRASGQGTYSHTGIDIPAPQGAPIYPPAEGVVTHVWNDTDHGGGLSVTVRHPDGRVTGYAHMRNQNVAVGDEVNINTPLGAVGNTGRVRSRNGGDGAHLHYTVRNAEGNRVDPTTQTWGGATPSGSPERAAATNDQTLAARLERAGGIADAQGFSRSQRNDLYRAVEQEHNRRERVVSAAQEQASDDAYAAIDAAEAAGQPVNLSTVPGFADMDPRARMQLRSYVNEGGGRDGSSTFVNLMEMSANPATQDNFASLDLNSYRGRISQGEYMSLVRDQLSIRYPNADRRGRGGDRSRSPAGRVSNARITQNIDALMPETGLDEGGDGRAAQRQRRTNRANLIRHVRDGLERWQAQNPGQEPTDDTIDYYVRTGSRVVRVNEGDRTTRARAYSVSNPQGFRVGEDVSQIPARDRSLIRESFRRQHGRLPTAAETLSAYYARLSQ